MRQKTTSIWRQNLFTSISVRLLFPLPKSLHLLLSQCRSLLKQDPPLSRSKNLTMKVNPQWNTWMPSVKKSLCRHFHWMAVNRKFRYPPPHPIKPALKQRSPRKSSFWRWNQSMLSWRANLVGKRRCSLISTSRSAWSKSIRLVAKWTLSLTKKIRNGLDYVNKRLLINFVLEIDAKKRKRIISLLWLIK